MAEYIEREALMRNFCGYDLTKCVKYGNKDAGQQHDSYSTMMMYEIADEIIDAPSADVAPDMTSVNSTSQTIRPTPTESGP